MTMKRFVLFFLFIFFLISFYTFIVPVRAQRVSYYEIEKAFSAKMPQDASNDIGDKPDGYFFTDTSIGYFNSDNGMTWRYDCPDKTYLTGNIYGYITYRDGENAAVIYSNSGRKEHSIGTNQVPYFAADLPFFYGVHRDGLGFCLYSLNGERMYDTVDYSSMITTINQNADGVTIVSDMGGNTNVYSVTGEVLYTTKADYSAVNFAKSSIISEDNQRYAVCVGLEPELIEIFSLKTGTRQHKFETDTNFHYAMRMYMNKDYLYYEADGSVNRYNLKKKKTDKFAYNGQMCDVKYDKDGCIYILSSETTNNESIYYLNLYAPNGIRQYYRELSGKVDNLNILQNGKFYFRLNENIVICNKTSV